MMYDVARPFVAEGYVAVSPRSPIPDPPLREKLRYFASKTPSAIATHAEGYPSRGRPPSPPPAPKKISGDDTANPPNRNLKHARVKFAVVAHRPAVLTPPHAPSRPALPPPALPAPRLLLAMSPRQQGGSKVSSKKKKKNRGYDTSNIRSKYNGMSNGGGGGGGGSSGNGFGGAKVRSQPAEPSRAILVCARTYNQLVNP